MKVLITGACGLLGAHLAVRLAGKHAVTGIDRNPWWGDLPLPLLQGDLSDPAFLQGAIRDVGPDILVHCAAMTDVDACEKNPEIAYRVNAEATRLLARAVSPPCLFVYVSTDAVFRGDSPLSGEDAIPLPRTVYARSKLHGEWEVQLAAANHLVVRTNFYGWSSGRKRTFGEWLYHALQRGKPVTLFEDVFFTPIYAGDLAERMEALLLSRRRGLVHLAGGERVSKSRFGALMAEMAGFSIDRAQSGSLAGASLAAPRAKDTSLDCGRFREWTGETLPDCRAGLARFLADKNLSLTQRTAGSGQMTRSGGV